MNRGQLNQTWKTQEGTFTFSFTGPTIPGAALVLFTMVSEVMENNLAPDPLSSEKAENRNAL